MPQVSRVGVDTAGGAINGLGGAGFKVAGKTISVVGDAVASHPPVPPHVGAPTMVTGQAAYRVNGKAVCRAGDTASCGHAATGSTAYRVV